MTGIMDFHTQPNYLSPKGESAFLKPIQKLYAKPTTIKGVSKDIFQREGNDPLKDTCEARRNISDKISKHMAKVICLNFITKLIININININ